MISSDVPQLLQNLLVALLTRPHEIHLGFVFTVTGATTGEFSVSPRIFRTITCSSDSVTKSLTVTNFCSDNDPGTVMPMSFDNCAPYAWADIDLVADFVGGALLAEMLLSVMPDVLAPIPLDM